MTQLANRSNATTNESSERETEKKKKNNSREKKRFSEMRWVVRLAFVAQQVAPSAPMLWVVTVAAKITMLRI
jgi:hypothetical protein